MKRLTTRSVDLEKLGQDFLKETLMLSVFFLSLFSYSFALWAPVWVDRLTEVYIQKKTDITDAVILKTGMKTI